VPGLDDLARLDLARPIATFVTDRGILREPGKPDAVEGVVVLDATPPRGSSRRRMTPERLEALANAVDVGRFDAIQAARIELHGVLATDVADENRAVSRTVAFADDVSATLAAAAVEAVAGHHEQEPVSAGLALSRVRALLLRRLRSLATVQRRDLEAAATTIARLVDGLVTEGRLARRGEVLSDPHRADDDGIAALRAAMDRLEAALALSAPPPLTEAAVAAGCPPEGVRTLQADGRIVRLGPDLAWATTTFHQLAAAALQRARSGPLTPAAFRDATGTSRKYVLAVLEELDRRGILQRTPEGHVPGPRAPGPDGTRRGTEASVPR
jgi:selenocysteine-specific elongation factor